MRTFWFGNGDFATFPYNKNDESRKATDYYSVGDWQITMDNGIFAKRQDDEVRINFPTGNSVVQYQSARGFQLGLSWDKDGKKPNYDNFVWRPGDLLYIAGQETPLEYVNVELKNSEKGCHDILSTKGFIKGNRIYDISKNGVVFSKRQIVNNFVINVNSDDSITNVKIEEYKRDPLTHRRLTIEYANGDNLVCDDNGYSLYYEIKSGTIHRNGGILTIKELNDRTVKVLTYPNGDKYVGDFYYDFDDSDGVSGHLYFDIFKLTDLSLPELSFKDGILIKANGKQIQYMNGKTEQQIAAERQAEQAKSKAKYNQLCKQYGKKYVDAALAQTPIVGMPEKLLQAAFNLNLVKSGANYKKYQILGLGWKDFGRTFSNTAHLYTIWVTNGRVSDVRYYGNR